MKRVQVSAYLTPAPASPTDIPLAQDDPDSGSRFTALRQFALEACVASCSSPDATWTPFYTSPADAFPSALPRPVAPTLNLREFDVPDTPGRRRTAGDAGEPVHRPGGVRRPAGQRGSTTC